MDRVRPQGSRIEQSEVGVGGSNLFTKIPFLPIAQNPFIRLCFPIMNWAVIRLHFCKCISRLFVCFFHQRVLEVNYCCAKIFFSWVKRVNLCTISLALITQFVVKESHLPRNRQVNCRESRRNIKTLVSSGRKIRFWLGWRHGLKDQ